MQEVEPTELQNQTEICLAKVRPKGRQDRGSKVLGIKKTQNCNPDKDQIPDGLPAFGLEKQGGEMVQQTTILGGLCTLLSFMVSDYFNSVPFNKTPLTE